MYEAVDGWKKTFSKIRKSHFFRIGLPILTLVVGGSFLTVEFQRIKYDARNEKYHRKAIEAFSSENKISLEKEAEKTAMATSVHNWINVRGPRPYEDNAEFLSLREAQERNLQKSLEYAEKNAQKNQN